MSSSSVPAPDGSERAARAGAGAAPGPGAALVVGMHESGGEAAAAALVGLGLSPPLDAVPGAAARSRALSAACDRLLSRLDRAFDDPPELAGADPGPGEVLRAGGRLEQVLPAGRPCCLEEPLLCLLLPFWRAALDRPLAAVLTVRHPLAVAGSLERRHGTSTVSALALWERYYRQALAGLDGLPVLVCLDEDLLERPAEWRKETAAFLCETGLLRDVPDDEGADQALAPPGRREGAGSSGDASLLLEPTRDLYDRLVSLRGPHPRFEQPALGGESEWAAGHLRLRHDLGVLWSAVRRLGDVPTKEPARRPGSPPAYPPDAAEDAAAYHDWLAARGEPTRLAAGGGLPPRSRRRHGDRPRFSVVTPVSRSRPSRLERSVTSVLTQDEESFELLLVDDGTADPLSEGHLRMIESLDDRVSLRSASGGMAAAANGALSSARGEWVLLLGGDDELAAGALRRLSEVAEDHPSAELIYSDEDAVDDEGRRFAPAFKPDWSPDLLLSTDYMGHLLTLRRRLVAQLGGLRAGLDGAEAYDLVLRATERLHADQIVHVPEVLYHRREPPGSPADARAGSGAGAAGRRALEDAVGRRGIEAEVVAHPLVGGGYHVVRRPTGSWRVSAVVPYRDEPALLAACYRALADRSGHDDLELLLVDNNSVLDETKAVVRELTRDRRVRHLEAPGAFNWARINNEAAAEATGDMLLFLNNDVEARAPGWLAHLLAQAEREEVGAVGARLVFADGSLQHGGVGVGLCFATVHLQSGLPAGRPGYLAAPSLTRDVSAVTGACMMTRREVFESAGGFDAGLPVAYNDIDYCLRLRREGLLVVYSALAELVHHESKTRGNTTAPELSGFQGRWREVLLAGDPYYNPNLGRFDWFCRLPQPEEEERWESFLAMLDASSTS